MPNQGPEPTLKIMGLYLSSYLDVFMCTYIYMYIYIYIYICIHNMHIHKDRQFSFIYIYMYHDDASN